MNKPYVISSPQFDITSGGIRVFKRDLRGKFLKGNKTLGKYPKNGEDRNCKFCENLFYAKRRDIKKGWGRFCSRTCWYNSPKTLKHRENIAKWQRGEKSRFWKGGISSKMEIKYSSYKWQKLRDAVYERDNRICRMCGKKLLCRNIACHHIIPYRIGKNMKFIYWNIKVDDKTNLVTLCMSCHKKADNIYQDMERRGYYGIPTVFNPSPSV